MILLLSGTSDGKEIAKRLSKEHVPYVSSYATAYGQTVGEVVRGRMDQAQLCAFIRERGITILVDATHPFAQEASKNAVAAAKVCGIPYIRYHRREETVSGVIQADSIVHAAKLAQGIEGTIFLTTGSKEIALFATEISQKERIVVRVLPTVEAIEACIACGIAPSNIIAMQGPFSKECNRALYREKKASVLVTKESGAGSGYRDKVEAAKMCGMQVISIRRPLLDCAGSVKTVEELLERLKDITNTMKEGDV